MPAHDLERATIDVLARLVQFNTVNPPGNERPAVEYLAAYLREAGFETEVLAVDESRPNLVADLRGTGDGPTLCYLGHVDTVLADPSEWAHDPWGGEVVDGFLWGRGAIDMKSQVAAEAAAAAALGRQGWRPANGHLKLVFTSDEEAGGDVGAHWLTDTHPDRVRCDMLINEGGGEHFPLDGTRYYGVCCGEKGVFRFNLNARGVAGHASLPRTGDNALLKLGPALDRLKGAGASFELTDVPEALLRGLGEDPADPAGALERLGRIDPGLLIMLEPMLSVTLTPTMAHASDKINVIPSRAQLRIDCRVPPGLGEESARRRIQNVLGDVMRELEVEFTEMVMGNESPVETPLMETIARWVDANDPQGETVPVLLPGFTDSRWFREAFPDCVAYGFFPQRFMTLNDVAPLVHSADERIDVRDLGLAAQFYTEIAQTLVG